MFLIYVYIFILGPDDIEYCSFVLSFEIEK